MFLDTTGRHPATQQIARFFEFDHLQEPLRSTARDCAVLAGKQLDRLPDGPELTAGLRKLLEAKDCFVRAALVALDGGPTDDGGTTTNP